MSKETITSLVARLRKIREIYEKGLQPFRDGAKGTTEAIGYLQALAAERGVDLTHEQLLTAVQETMSAESLSEETLDMVAGGITTDLFRGIKVGLRPAGGCQPQTDCAKG
jgi:hypothetical protein